MFANDDGENVAGFDGMAALADTFAVQADLACFYQFGGSGSVLGKAGVNQPLVQALCQSVVSHGGFKGGQSCEGRIGVHGFFRTVGAFRFELRLAG
jgi:hypothetical protein